MNKRDINSSIMFAMNYGGRSSIPTDNLEMTEMARSFLDSLMKEFIKDSPLKDEYKNKVKTLYGT